LHYIFDWDPAKERENIRKHRVAFYRAALTFRDPNHLSIYDERHSEDEDRWVTIGTDTAGVPYVVVHTFAQVKEDSCRVRIISARKATAAEARQYFERNQ
jgi:Uncharacterized protein conserved in bacteria